MHCRKPPPLKRDPEGGVQASPARPKEPGHTAGLCARMQTMVPRTLGLHFVMG